MKRRKFLAVAGIGGIIGAIVSGRFLLTTFEDAVVQTIKNELSFLDIEEEHLYAFAKDYGSGKSRPYKLIIKGYSVLGVSANRSGKIHHKVSSFLLSSDFFQNNMDEKRSLRYMALYDPYRRPCAHPFSSMQNENKADQDAV